MATTPPVWTIDPVHSSVEFSLDYMGFTTYRTGFRALEGSLRFDAGQPAASSVTASIPVASVDVTNDRLMSRLMDADLLGGKDHPTITFQSTRVEAVDSAHLKVTGDLTIHGVTRPVGKLALADFVNPAGLLRSGDNLFQASLNSGDPLVATAGSGIEASVFSGSLEQSNVDLAREFTNMILAQRGFQASARVITTSDEVLSELLNIKR